jgi:hypothetical protein
MQNQKLQTILNALMVSPNVFNANTVKDYIDAATAANPPKTLFDVSSGECFSNQDAAWEELEQTFVANGIIDYDDPDYADEDASEIILDMLVEYFNISALR